MQLIRTYIDDLNNDDIIKEYFSHLDNKEFPCIAAKAASAKQQVKCFVAGHMQCPNDNADILKFLYDFIEEYRNSDEFYHSAAIIFKQEGYKSEELFEEMMWQKLQTLSDMDAENFNFDKRVSADPRSPDFSFSLKEEAFYIVVLHPASSRPARQFKYPALVFNPHDQFEKLRMTEKYDRMKVTVRKRDISLAGSINPMLEDFGKTSEVHQYSGRFHDESWKCPLNIKHLS